MGSPILRALVQLVPRSGGSAAESYLSARLDDIKREPFQAFFDELGRGTLELPQKTVETEDFVHAFGATTRAGARSRRHEKAQLFARRLRGAFSASISSVDEYEALRSILDELSDRELSILSTLANFERMTNFVGTGNDLGRARKVWPKFEDAMRERFGLEPEDLCPPFLCVSNSPDAMLKLPVAIGTTRAGARASPLSTTAVRVYEPSSIR